MFGQFSEKTANLLSETAIASTHCERYLVKKNRGMIQLHPDASILAGFSCQSSRGAETRNVHFL